MAIALLATFSLVLTSSVAHGEKTEVVVLPMTSTAKNLRLYERAIASALAKELNRDSMISAGSVASVSEVPKGAAFIIEGRLVAKGRGRVLMEARVRQASTGRALATLATPATAITKLDSLVVRLAAQLLPALRRASQAKPPTVLPPVPTRPKPNAEVSPPSLANEPARALDLDILLIPAGGSAAKGVVSVQEPATASAQAMLSRMGYRSATSTSYAGITNVPGAVTELRGIGATYVLMINVREVSFAYQAVLSARGTVQVALFDTKGEVVFASTVSTDTVVGARGDRHQALVYQVVSQALDILLPEFRKIVPARRSGARG